MTPIRWLALVCIAAGATAASQEPARRPLLIAHRGASGSAPEHTLAAYELAIAQGADFVEQDLQLTKDGVLIRLHDADLARTTNVAEVFPGRATERDVSGKGKPKRGWYSVDFTLAEIKRLDAGSWFSRANPFAAKPEFAGQRVPTLEEAIEQVRGRAGLYIELKHFAFYKSQGFDSAEKLAAVLKSHGFDGDGRRERIFIQSFSKASLLRMRELAPAYRRVQLLPMSDRGREKDSSRITSRLAQEIAGFASGVGPSTEMLKSKADVELLHAAALLVHPYTFRGPTTAAKRLPLQESRPGGTVRQEIISEIREYLQMGIDGGFTDYPELWKESAAR